MKRHRPGGPFENGDIHSGKSPSNCVMFNRKCRGCGGGVDFIISVNVSTIKQLFLWCKDIFGVEFPFKTHFITVCNTSMRK